MTLEEFLVILDTILKPKYLNYVQEIVLRQSWEGRTYSEIAASYGYDPEYIKNVGFGLWQSLSEKLGEKVSKSNFRSIVRRRSSNLTTGMHTDINTSWENTLLRVKEADVEERLSIPVSQKQEPQTHPESDQNSGLIIKISEWKASPEKESEKRKLGEQESEFKRFVEAENNIWIKTFADQSEKISDRLLPITNSPAKIIINCRQDWEKIIDVSIFFGCDAELDILKQWIVQERCRLVALFGMGGIGKTALSLKFAQAVAENFECLMWRSLLYTPSVTKLISNWIQFIHPQQNADLPEDLDSCISKLIEYLQKYRCLLVLDDVETILESENIPSGTLQERYEDYGLLFKRLGEEIHDSTILLVGCEQPKELISLSGKKVRSLQLNGLSESAALEIFQEKDCFGGQEDECRKVIQLYQGNPLALKIVSTTIQELFDSKVTDFLAQGTIVFGNIREVLESAV